MPQDTILAASSALTFSFIIIGTLSLGPTDHLDGYDVLDKICGASQKNFKNL
jgi:hypothetical protein